MAVVPAVRATLAQHDPALEVEQHARLNGEPIVHFERSPGKVQVELKDLDSLFDRDAPPSYPHSGPMLNAAVARFLLNSVRQDRRKPSLELTVAFTALPLPPEEEASIRAQMSSFFANEADLAALENRVNRTEGLGSLWFAIPVVVVAALIAGVLSANSPLLGGPPFLTTALYLVVITVAWVMLWDPIEKLLFDPYLILLRIRALHKLSTATTAFVYRPMSGVVAAPIPD